MMDSVAISVVDFAGWPVGGEAGGEAELGAFEMDAEEGFEDEAIGPAGGACVPSPAAATGVWRDCVDVGGDDIGLDAVSRNGFG